MNGEEIKIPADILRHAANAMSTAERHCEHGGVQAQLRIWAGTLRDFLPETLEEEKKKQKSNNDDS